MFQRSWREHQHLHTYVQEYVITFKDRNGNTNTHNIRTGVCTAVYNNWHVLLYICKSVRVSFSSVIFHVLMWACCKAAWVYCCRSSIQVTSGRDEAMITRSQYILPGKKYLVSKNKRFFRYVRIQEQQQQESVAYKIQRTYVCTA